MQELKAENEFRTLPINVEQFYVNSPPYFQTANNNMDYFKSETLCSSIQRVVKLENTETLKIDSQNIESLDYRNKSVDLTSDFLLTIEFITHNNSTNENYLIRYLLGELDKLYKFL